MCPNCQNKQGFVCGTCIECGFNHSDGKFHWIRVWVEDIHPSHDEAWLIEKHRASTHREPLGKSEGVSK